MFRVVQKMYGLLPPIDPPPNHQPPGPRQLIFAGVCVAFAFLLSICVYTGQYYWRHNFLLSTKDSVLPGLYMLSSNQISSGSIVLFHPQQRIDAHFHSVTGRHLPERGVLKPVYRVGPFEVCHNSTGIYLDKKLLPWSLFGTSFNLRCFPFGDDAVFVMSDRTFYSLDSRHYGPISRDDVVGVFVPIFTWKAPDDDGS